MYKKNRVLVKRKQFIKNLQRPNLLTTITIIIKINYSRNVFWLNISGKSALKLVKVEV